MTDSSPLLTVSGLQEPRLSLVRSSEVDFADEASEFASAYGLTPDEWQHSVLAGWLAQRADGKWSHSRCGLSVPRQNGKNALLEIRELFGMVGLGEKILHTAHELKTARKAFVRLSSFFEDPVNYPELADLVSVIRKANGQEAIILTNGGSVEFVARSKGSARGYTVDVVVMDEAQEMSDEALEALGPTTASAPLKNRQMIWVGTPPAPGMISDVFTRLRDEALEGRAKRLCWHEWSIEPGADLDDPATWAQANPALGGRLGAEELEEDRGSYSDEGFARERCGAWDAGATSEVIPGDVWDALADPRFRSSDSDVCIGIDVSPSRTMASIVGASRGSDGRIAVDLIQRRNGAPDWVVPYVLGLVERNEVRAVVIDKAGPAANFIDQLGMEKVRVTETDADKMKRACASFFDSVASGALVHLDQPDLSVAVSHGRKRRLGDGWAWNRASADADITPLVAATLASWAMASPFTKKASRKRRRGGERRKVVIA